MVQANSGMYRVQDTYLEACHKFQRQDSKLSSEWESFDMNLWPKTSQDEPDNPANPGENSEEGSGPKDQDSTGRVNQFPLVGQDIFMEEASLDLDNESEWSLDLPPS
jgi:hypothetical protein